MTTEDKIQKIAEFEAIKKQVLVLPEDPGAQNICLSCE